MPPSKTGSCSHCNSSSQSLRACAGICCGNVAYCDRDCQLAHYPIHKKSCWKKARCDTLTIPNPRGAGHPDIPVRAYHQKDGFGCSGLRLHYSDHLGEEMTRPHVIEYFGEVDNEMGWNAEGLATISFDILTNPVHDVLERKKLKPGEAVFNITNNPEAVTALIDAGIIKNTGKHIQMGLYPPHPVCRINLPYYDNEYEE